MIIYPEILVTPDFPTVKFRESMDQVNLNVEIPKILYSQGWGVGTYFNVQFTNFDKSKLVSSGLFVVTEECESLQTSNPEGYQPMTKSIAMRKAEQIGTWFISGEAVRPRFDETTDIKPELRVRWNPGKKVFQVMSGDEVVYENSNRTEAEKFKEAA